jgi:predicted AAA+ superfamily ATPase
MESYFQTYLERDIRRLFPGLNLERYRQFVRMLAGVSGAIINYSEIGRALGTSAPSVRDYFEIAHGSFLWRTIPAFTRPGVKRLVRHPKGYMRDSGLLHYLLKIPDLEILRAHPVLGRSWESMVTEEIIRGLNCRGIPHESFFYRTRRGAEVDLVLSGQFGLVPVEIKWSQSVSRRDTLPLEDFMEEYKLQTGILINNGETVMRLSEKIIAIPFGCLFLENNRV